MRNLAVAMSLLLAFGGLAGCIGGDKEGDPVETNSAGSGTGAGTGTGTGTGSAPQLKVLAPLTSTLTIDAPEWVASGTEVPVKLAAPGNAKGGVTYAWAIGALPGTAKVDAVVMDTGSKGADYIQPGASKTLTFSTAGAYRMHCHPHPYMLHNVTVVDGYGGPKTVDVFITDGANQNEYRFVPENIVVAPGTKVNYKNVGTQPHTSTAMGAQEPPLKLLPLAAAEGNAKVEGNGWQRLVAIVKDGEGRLGLLEKGIYVTPELPTFATKTITMDFTHGSPAQLAGTPAAAAAKSEAVTLDHGGLVKITYDFKDAPAANGAPENLAEIELHFTKDGETQDTLTGGPAPAGSAEGKALPGAYTVRVLPMQGAGIEGTITIDVVYDLVPPAPAMPAEGGGHDHGGGGHQH